MQQRRAGRMVPGFRFTAFHAPSARPHPIWARGLPPLWEPMMAKGQRKSNKEIRKPKANKDAPKTNASQPSLKAGGIKGLENMKNG